MLAIEINDAGLRVSGAGGILADSPGYALVNGDVTVGETARSAARLQPGRVFDDFWGDLSLEALPAAVRAASTYADLAYHHLAQVWAALPERGDDAILSVPGNYTREQLSLLLGIARECGIGVRGLVDQAIVAADEPAPGRQLYHLDLLLQRAVLTGLVQGARLRRERVATVEDVGLSDFYNRWANAVGDAFVRNTRFDPMHSAESEQVVYDRLPEWIAAVGRDGRAELTLTHAGRDHVVVVTDATLAQAAEPLYRPITRQIAAASRPGEPLTLLISDRMQHFPGLREAVVASLPHCEIVDLAPAQAARGVLRRRDEIVSAGESVAFVTSIAWHRGSVSLPLPDEQRPAAGRPPSHVVYRGRGWPIGNGGLAVGAQPASAGGSIVMTGDLAGVSGEHCRIDRRDSGVYVEDRSEHGTYLNDRRIDGEAEVRYGDVLRLGGPDQILQFVDIRDGDGA